MLGYFADWRDAWLVACADFLGDRVRGRAVYRLEEGMWELDSVCGSLNCVELQMPESEPKPVRGWSVTCLRMGIILRRSWMR